MSIRALCEGVVETLKGVLNDPDGKSVGYQPSGRPPPRFGQTYVAVSFAGSRSEASDPDRDERTFDVAVTITHRTAYAPADRRGKEAAKGDPDAALTLADELPGYFVGRWEPVQKANALIAGAGVATNGFCETFQSASVGELEEPGADWLSGSGPGNEPGVQVIRITLSGARRIRLLGTIS